VFPNAVRETSGESNFELLKIDNFFLEIVPADHKVRSGKAGTVMYWQVTDLQQAINKFTNLGASLYRGPLAIENDSGMCQLEDPFGNLIGLRGHWRS